MTCALASGLSLRGVHPNPSPGRLTVSFVLPSDAPAEIEVLDVSGRRVLLHGIGHLGVGSHVVNLKEHSLAFGVYMVRFTQAGHSVMKRAVVVR